VQIGRCQWDGWLSGNLHAGLLKASPGVLLVLVHEHDAGLVAAGPEVSTTWVARVMLGNTMARFRFRFRLQNSVTALHPQLVEVHAIPGMTGG
jgi:hypothetical protein